MSIDPIAVNAAGKTDEVYDLVTDESYVQIVSVACSDAGGDVYLVDDATMDGGTPGDPFTGRGELIWLAWDATATGDRIQSVKTTVDGGTLKTATVDTFFQYAAQSTSYIIPYPWPIPFLTSLLVTISCHAVSGQGTMYGAVRRQV